MDPVASRETGDNFNRHWYANNNPTRFVDPDGRENVLGITAEYRIGFTREDSPSAQDVKVLGATQRAVDLHVDAAMASGDPQAIKLASTWVVFASPDINRTQMGGFATTTVQNPGTPDEVMVSDFSSDIAGLAEPGGTTTFYDGVTAKNGDPALLHVASHEAAHGTTENRKIEEKKPREQDAGRRAQKIEQSSTIVPRD